MSLSERFWSAPSKLVNGYLPRETQPVKEETLDVPTFMRRNKPVSKPAVKSGRQSFQQIKAEAERILR